MALTVTSGQRITAALLNSYVPKYLLKAADESRTSNTTFANDATFAGISFAAGETWACEMALYLTGSTTGDFKYTFTVTGGTTVGLIYTSSPAVGSTTDANALDVSAIQARLSTATIGIGTFTGGTFTAGTIRFIVTSTTAGTMTLQWAQNSSNATATILKSGSYFAGHRVD